MQFDIVTLFPEMFQGYLSQSILHKAIQRGIIGVRLVNLRDWSEDKHHRVDDRPYGGGPGMVLMVEPVVKCVEALQHDGHLPARVVLLTPQGKRFNQRVVEDLAQSARLILLCGRYEGFDQRIVDILQPEEISLGDFILNGGEVAAMAVMDAVIRLVPEVLGDERSSLEDSFSQQYPGLKAEQYTRPREFRGHTVPEILLSGDHQAIARWRAERSRARTAARRTHRLVTVSPADRMTREYADFHGNKTKGLCPSGETTMRNKFLELVEQTCLKEAPPQFEVGDTVDVHTKILEGDKERIQIFTGTVIAKSGSGTREMFTVRRIVAGEGVERKFPLHSPKIAKVEVKRKGVARRAKLYYLRDRVGKSVRLRERRVRGNSSDTTE